MAEDKFKKCDCPCFRLGLEEGYAEGYKDGYIDKGKKDLKKRFTKGSGGCC